MTQTHFVDQEARNMAQAATSAIASHERVCAERWRSTMDTMKDIKRILAWGIIGLIGSMGAFIAWLAAHPLQLSALQRLSAYL